MAGNERPSFYCEQCGTPLYTGDAFCGACGTRAPEPPVQDASTSEIPARNLSREPDTRRMSAAPTGGPLASGRATSRGQGNAPVRDGRDDSGGLWVPVAVLAAALVLLLGSGAIAYTLFGNELRALLPGGGDSGNSQSQAASDGPEQGGAVTESQTTTVVEPTTVPSTGEVTALPEETPEEEVEAAIRAHYEAIGDGDFEEAYSYFGPSYTANVSEEDWVSEEDTYDIQGSTIHSVQVEEVSGSEAEATVDVEFEDNTGTPRFEISWALVQSSDGWKLDEITDSE